MDGWSTLQNDPVVGISITSNGQTCLVETVDTKGSPHTAEYMANIALAAIPKAEEMFGARIGHVVTDGASNMSSMREIISVSMPEIITYHCQAHLFNLLAKDIRQEQSTTVNKVISVLKYFRNKHNAAAKLDELNLAKPPLPCETRWNTLRDSLAYYCQNWAVLVQAIADLQGTNGNERKYLENMQIKSAANDLLVIFDVISKALNRVQADSATIADSVDAWLEVVDQMMPLNNQQVINFAKERCDEAISEPAFLAAYLMDHRYMGARLIPDQIRVATQFIKGLNVDASTALTTMIANAPPYNQSILSADVSPVVWWSAGKRLGFDNALCDVALKLVSAVANSAGLERQFSTMKLTFGTLRTQLGIEKAGKISFCYRSLSQKQE